MCCCLPAPKLSLAPAPKLSLAQCYCWRTPRAARRVSRRKQQRRDERACPSNVAFSIDGFSVTLRLRGLQCACDISSRANERRLQHVGSSGRVSLESVRCSRSARSAGVRQVQSNPRHLTRGDAPLCSRPRKPWGSATSAEERAVRRSGNSSGSYIGCEAHAHWRN